MKWTCVRPGAWKSGEYVVVKYDDLWDTSRHGWYWHMKAKGETWTRGPFKTLADAKTATEQHAKEAPR